MSNTTVADAAVAAAILALEDRRRHALVAVDLAALDEIFAEDLVHIHAPGVTHTKPQLLEHTATRRPYLEITRGALSVRVYGDTAVMTGPISNRLRTIEGGERILGGVATQVAVRGDDGRWRFVSFQMTPAGDQAWPALPSEADEADEAAAAADRPEAEETTRATDEGKDAR